ncbi:MAG: tryptophan synthase subunit alpha [Longimicrobiales bacterium]|nr:tryptophan synthase subunit alpha [Longimicrobiales bacterium]
MISSTFRACREEGRAALVPYFTAGHPSGDATVEVLSALAEAGADVIELGIPFSDPLADGPTIQASSFSSLQSGTTVERVLRDLAAFRRLHTTPVVLFTYLNPVLRFGVDRFLAGAAESGAHGLLLTDLPTGADPELEEAVVASPLDLIRLVAPTTSPSRVPEVARGGSGFLYYISRTGVTGARQALRGDLRAEVEAIRRAVELPVAVGFGISTPEQAAVVGALADGVVVGSAFVQRLGDEGIDAGIDFIRSLRRALDD